jgi:hypothetical protein
MFEIFGSLFVFKKPALHKRGLEYVQRLGSQVDAAAVRVVSVTYERHICIAIEGK